VKILFNIWHAGYLKHFDAALGVLCDQGHSVHLAFHTERKVDIAKATQELLAVGRDVTITQAPRRSDKWTGFIFRLRAARNYLMYFDQRYAGKNRLRAAAAAELKPRDRALVELLVAIPGMRKVLDRLLYLIERAVPSDPGIDAFVREIAPDALLVSPLVWFNSLQVDYIKTARALGIPSALCVASWDNLTNKGQMRELPDRVTVWNAAQIEEAVTLHGYPRDRVVVTGAQTFDEWFEFRPSRSKEAFLSERGLEAGTPLLVYLCSSPSIAPHEVDLVRRWQEAVRGASDPNVARAAILVRPHPYNAQPWERLDLLGVANFAVWPREPGSPFDPQWQHDYFDSMYHADAVIGLNTSGLIEAGLIGKPVLTLLSKDIPDTLQGTKDTLHFDHLLEVNGGLLHVAASWEEHVQHLKRAIGGDPAMAERSRRFTEAFIRPHGIDKPATPILVEAIRSLPEVKRRDSWLERVLCELVLRSLLEVVLFVPRAFSWARWRSTRLLALVKAALGGRKILPGSETESNSAIYPQLVTLNADDKAYNFLCHSKKEARRVGGLFSKEPGTIAWLKQTLRPDDIFFDIGANIGVYSIFAAREVGAGSVYAFEPHVANAASLLHNVVANDLAGKVHVVTAPLSNQDGFGAFHYHSLEPSRSHSQFGPAVLDGESFAAVAAELKYGCRLDSLVESGVLPAPTIVKIDVDGIEAEILAGMKALLASPNAPRSIQVEITKDNAEKIIGQMIAAGYEPLSRHWSKPRQAQIAQGANPLAEFPHNIIFAKVAAPVERSPADLSLARAGSPDNQESGEPRRRTAKAAQAG
jgi:FkbM family methyltransferase